MSRDKKCFSFVEKSKAGKVTIVATSVLMTESKTQTGESHETEDVHLEYKLTTLSGNGRCSQSRVLVELLGGRIGSPHRVTLHVAKTSLDMSREKYTFEYVFGKDGQKRFVTEAGAREPLSQVTNWKVVIGAMPMVSSTNASISKIKRDDGPHEFDSVAEAIRSVSVLPIGFSEKFPVSANYLSVIDMWFTSQKSSSKMNLHFVEMVKMMTVG